MSQLNKATQQNAAASEELAATSEELTGQAGQLQEAVAFFRSVRETAATPRSHGEMTRFTERRAPNSPLRSPSATSAAAFSAPPAAAARSQATGTHGNFRPY
jgi:methyl-accepting chemotaxis protein